MKLHTYESESDENDSFSASEDNEMLGGAYKKKSKAIKRGGILLGAGRKKRKVAKRGGELLGRREFAPARRGGVLLGAGKKKKVTRKTNNPWIEHVKDFQHRHGISYADAMVCASDTYKKKGGAMKRKAAPKKRVMIRL